MLLNNCSTVSPAANFSRINSTVMRVPAITGLPIITPGSETTDVSVIAHMSPFNLSVPRCM